MFISIYIYILVQIQHFQINQYQPYGYGSRINTYK